ncbi:MAG: hypothetical protein JRI92_12780 [Deltaproteobacteria bacterium]|nr:hypothetical protein [Deltaproteobacteria bacterium]
MFLQAIRFPPAKKASPPGKKSISIRVTYRSSKKTLEDEDVGNIHKMIADRLIKKFDAGLPE